MSSSTDIYKIIFEHAKTGLILVDKVGTVIAANKIFCDLSGYSPEEIENKSSYKSLVYEEDLPRIGKVFDRISDRTISDDSIHEFRLLRKNKELIDVAATFSFAPESGYTIATILNITEKKRITQNLIRRDAILEAINYASNRFLKAESWTDVMPDVLKNLGEASKVARIFYFENSVDEKTGDILMNERFEWSYDTDTAQIENKRMQGLSYKEAGVLRWQKELEKGNIIFADINTVDKEERENMELLGVRTSVITPIFLNDRWWGFVGLDETREDREWTDAEIDVLGAAAGIIGNAIYKQESYEALLAYITESALRLKEPVIIVRDNISQIKTDISEDVLSLESITTRIDIQVKNIDQIIKNLRDLNIAIIEKRSEIPKAYRDFISR